MRKISKISLLSGLLSIGLFFSLTTAHAQDSKLKNNPALTKKPTKKVDAVLRKGQQLPDGFTLLPSGLEYKIMEHGDGKKNPVITDHLELNISYHIGDSVMFDSRKMNNNNPVPIPCAAPRGPGDPSEVFMLMVAGDSAVIRYPLDSLKKAGQAPPFAKPGDRITYYVKMVSVKSDAEDKKDATEKAAVQIGIDDKLLQAHFMQNNLKPKKTASGLYYVITKEGKGDNIKVGQNTSVYYTGMFLDGKKFDSNTDSAFHHMTPFGLEVGKGRVIKGWDEGLQLLKIGSKATFYIPSPLAYGPQDQRGIPANSILVFDVEILDLPDQSKLDDKLITEYLAKNNIKATKSASGLYYVITQKGLGENAKAGKKVTMNYTGKLLDGTTFDSNTDPKFNHIQPFSFALGQGQVIKGWDEGVQLLKLGSKGSFYIPSALGYGPNGTGPIPANAVLIFDVEVTGIDK